ncbi:MAG: 6-phosphofructokinase [Clostridiales bacterium]|nr:6-phosphofructokinase [Clostridiales bacterium]
MIGNVIVGQSGGPTAAINASLAGVYHSAKERGAGKVYGMIHGIQGLIEGKYVDLSKYIKDGLDEELLKRTPAAYLGSCRYKMPDAESNPQVYDTIFKLIDKLEISVFIYIGGNDSMDTIQKLSEYGAKIGHACRFVGCPKTIDNDLPLTDHTPGYGSAAKFVATAVKEIVKDTYCLEYSKGLVTIIEIMGRDAGWLTGAAALSKGEDCVGPDMIYLPEVPFSISKFLNKIEKLLKKKPCVVIAVSEGVKNSNGEYICNSGTGAQFTDAFGHKQLTGTASYLSRLVSAEIGAKTRSVELSSLQRAASHCASRMDLIEAFQAGGAAVIEGEKGNTGVMVTFERVSDNPYNSRLAAKDVTQIANGVRHVPVEWINDAGDGVKEEFFTYARPLIRGEVGQITVDGIPRHLPSPVMKEYE